MKAKSLKHEHYFVPPSSPWPFLMAVALLCFGSGFIGLLHSNPHAHYFFFAGLSFVLMCTFGWFREVIQESLKGLNSRQMDRSYRWGMFWFIISEVFFFGAFFGALAYVRMYVITSLGGSWQSPLTHDLLWPNFQAVWPLLTNPDPSKYVGPHTIVDTWHLPALNTALLLSSAVTLTIAHHALRAGHRGVLHFFMMATIALGVVFEYFQFHEYQLAFNEYGLTLNSGIYGSTFFMLTGFHALHVIIGLTILSVVWVRCMKGHFTKDNHFGFEAAAWYWHFVDIVWLGLFIFVYWL